MRKNYIKVYRYGICKAQQAIAQRNIILTRKYTSNRKVLGSDF
jgi:hypothetical protein